MEPATADTTMTDNPSLPSKSTNPKSKSKKRKHSAQSHEITSLTLKHPPFSYIHLTLLTSTTPSTQPATPDILTYRTYLTRALTQFLGLHGSSIPIDILKINSSSENIRLSENGVEGESSGKSWQAERNIWIRVPREDCGAVVAAVGGWSTVVAGEEIAWRVRSRGEWLGGVVAKEGIDRLWGD